MSEQTQAQSRLTVKDYEDRYDVAHAVWRNDPNLKTAEALDRAKAALWRARNWPEGSTR